MTSDDFSKLSVDTLNTIKYNTFEEAGFSVALAQTYATLSVAAAQREWNDMSRDNYDGACVRTYQKDG